MPCPHMFPSVCSLWCLCFVSPEKQTQTIPEQERHETNVLFLNVRIIKIIRNEDLKYLNEWPLILLQVSINTLGLMHYYYYVYSTQV